MMDSTPENKTGESTKKIAEMYKEWFLDYSSYVILSRAIPSIYDGLSPCSVVFYTLCERWRTGATTRWQTSWGTP